MDPRPSHRATDVKIIALLAVMFTCLTVLVVLLFHDASASASRMQPMLFAHAAVLHAAPSPTKSAVKAEGDGGATGAVTPEENWAADDASAGLRPDAAH